jgi:FMN-dependent NADH-azoreductase
MTTILHLICSPRGEAESTRLSRRVLDGLLRRHPGATVVTRPIGSGEIPYIDEDYAISLASPTDVSQAGSLALSEQLILELESADIAVIGTPMHNFTVPAALKAWIDHVVRARRTLAVTPEGKFGLLSDRPVYVAIASGGRFSGPRARQPDFLTPYLRAVLGVIGLHDVTFFSVEGTAMGPDAAAKAWAEADQAVTAHFSQEALVEA